MANPSIDHSAIAHWDGPFNLPDFGKIEDKDFADAIKQGFAADLAEHEAVAQNSDAPTFENTIEALERSGTLLSKAASLFFAKAGNHTNEIIQGIEREIAPLFARHSGQISQNKKLFERIDTLWEKRDELGLSGEQFQVLKRYHRGFVRGGAQLQGDEQKELVRVNERLASLGTQFGQNVLRDESDWMLVLESRDELAGLPKSLIAAMASAAKDRGHDGKHAVTLSRSIIDPFLTFSARADLREKAFAAWTARGEKDGASDNRPIIAETLQLRARKAALLGFDSFADMKLDGTMAKTPAAVDELLETVWEKALARAEEEAEDIAQVMRDEGVNSAPKPSDWRYYAEKIRAERYDYSDDEVKPYLALEKMIEAAFYAANRLFGLTFTQIEGFTLWHGDVRVWEVKDSQGAHKALFVGDYFARPSKRSGAWMSALQMQSKLRSQTPIITNTMNFAKPPEGEDAFLSFDDARTLFHEFGHGLHGMLSDVTYPSVAGTSVARDFVELPSQLYEHWLTVPEILEKFATHNETGAPMPPDLLDKVMAARNFNAGFSTVEYTASARIDMDYHKSGEAPADPAAFEAQRLAAIDLPSAITMRHRSPHFQHIFAGDGYAAGYYSYIWSEVLDADAFEAFEETGDAFNAQMAEKLKTHIYSSGGSMEPEAAYLAFRGQLPSPDAMLKGRGLI